MYNSTIDVVVSFANRTPLTARTLVSAELHSRALSACVDMQRILHAYMHPKLQQPSRCHVAIALCLGPR
jgi:hypothetical protein